MLVLNDTDNLAAKQDAGTDCIVHVGGMEITDSSGLGTAATLRTALSVTAAVVATSPATGKSLLISNIKVTIAAVARVVTFYKTVASTTYDATTQWGTAISLAANESAEWKPGTGWTIYNASGIPKVVNASSISLKNAATAAVTGYAADTYLVGSSIAIPTGMLAAKTVYRCRFDVVKTAAGIAAPTINVRFGTAGAVGDVSRCLFTFSAQTAVIDRGTFEVDVTFNSVGSGTAAVIAGNAELFHQLAVTGLNTVQPVGYQQLTTIGGGFDSTPAGSIIGLSVNGGGSAAWTISVVQAELVIP